MALPWVKLILHGLLFAAICGTIALMLCIRALSISQNSKVPKWRRKNSPTHLLVVLGSGGHTAEMFSMLRRMRLDPSTYTHRTYVVSSGDDFSAARAVEFETEWLKQNSKLSFSANGSDSAESYTIVTVPRARRVHQSYLTAPLSTLQCFYACLLVLRGCHPEQKSPLLRTNSPYPDVILTNGPATAVCMILAAKSLRLFHYLGSLFSLRNHLDRDSPRSSQAKRSEDAPAPVHFRLRTIYVESWARVTTFSLSGKLLLPFADRFLVQWPALAGKQAWRGMRKTEYAGRNALITGGSRGLGAVVAQKYAAEGCNVAINYVSSKDVAEELASSLQTQYGVKAITVQGDASRRQDCSNAIKTTIEQLAGLDIVVSNAVRSINAMDDDDWDKCWSTNVKSSWYLFKEALPTFNANPDGGVFIITSSTAAITPSGSSIPYAVSKAAGLHLMKCLAQSQGSKVRVNAVVPALLLTEWGQRFPPEKIAAFKNKTVLGKLPEVEDAANAYIMLAQNSSMTGQSIQVDAGFAIK
ncbi:hypothetical protein CNMCM5793_004614 [Aspergillus hiratsukae]|uniref:UDP-N-acetylglucosamine transferase subunit ALG14 n=1 Tax=Aspergillus hiratsukae TaxID=1194566 RepID=A0A8H6UAE8_9EURO|nr:hypothetical protein CNMCM5793_004614 [Aspergillus hiratsukae]